MAAGHGYEVGRDDNESWKSEVREPRSIMPIEENVDDFLAEGGIPSAKFEKVGDTISGKVVSAFTRQQTDMDTGEPLTWDDGRPKMMLLVDISTDLRNPDIAGDDGTRRVYGRSALLTAIRQAVRGSGGKLMVDGDLTVTRVEDGQPPKKGYNAPHVYRVEYVAPKSGVNVNDIA